MREATRIIRSTLAAAKAGEALRSGPVFAASYDAPGDPSQTSYTDATAETKS